MQLKKLIRFLILGIGIFLLGDTYAQIKVGDNANTVDPRAILELESTSKALYLPRLTNAQIAAQTGWKAGMIVYNSTDSSIQTFDGQIWYNLPGSADLSDLDSTNELQLLSLSNDTLYISDGNWVYLGGFLDDFRSELQDSLDAVRGDFADSLAQLNADFVNSLTDIRGDMLSIDALKDSTAILRSVLSDSTSDIRSAIDDTASAVRSDLADSLAVAQGVLADTASDLRTDLATKAALVDTAGDIRTALLDTASAIRSDLGTNLNGKLNISDTAAMLAPYLLETDTASMLANYFLSSDTTILSDQIAENKQAIIDTASDLRTDLATKTALLDTASAIRSDIGTNLNGKLNISDTAAMLAPYLLETDTASMLANYFLSSDTIILSDQIADNRQAIIDTASDLRTDLATKTALLDTASAIRSDLGTNLNGKLNISDTAAMLAPYLLETDTASMLANYFLSSDTSILSDQIAENRQAIIDTASDIRTALLDTASAIRSDIGTNLNGKLNISDTAAMLAPYLLETDTAPMLANYFLSSDTTILSDQIAENKQAIIDTASDLRTDLATKSALVDTASAVRSSMLSISNLNDTASNLRADLATKVALSDTAASIRSSMLSIDNLKDTASNLRTDLATKVALIDTASSIRSSINDTASTLRTLITNHIDLDKDTSKSNELIDSMRIKSDSLFIYESSNTKSVAIIYGSKFNLFQAASKSNVTGIGTSTIINSTTSSLTPGLYEIQISYLWSYDDNNTNFESFLTFGGAALSSQGNLIHSEAIGFFGIQTRNYSKTFYTNVTSAGTKTVNFSVGSTRSGRIASVWDVTIKVIRVE